MLRAFAVAIEMYACALALSGCDGLCANEQLSESTSPSGRLRAVTFRRDCGATTGFSTQVSVLVASKPLPNEAGNVFIIEGEPRTIVRWITDQHLSISCSDPARDFKHETSFGDVQITYDGPPSI